MIEKIINDPDEVRYPLSRAIYTDSRIVYHGTSSCYTEKIEAKGWCRNDQPYEMNDIKFTCELLESLDYFNQGCAVLRPFTLGVSDDYLEKKLPSFTSSYWMARLFASVPGGETINSLFDSLNDFINFLNSNDLKQKHVDSLQPNFEKYDDFLKKIKITDPNFGSINWMYQKYKKALEMMNNNQFLSTTLKKVLILKEKYEVFVKNIYGVVYVLRVKPEWFENWREPFKIKNKKGLNERTDFLANTNISSENIIAKISFLKGIKVYLPASNVPLPLPWAMEEFKKYVADSFLPRREKFLKKYID